MNITDFIVIKRKKVSLIIEHFLKLQICVNLVLALQKLFGLMLCGNKNVLDPSEVINSIVDGHGKD